MGARLGTGSVGDRQAWGDRQVSRRRSRDPRRRPQPGVATAALLLPLPEQDRRDGAGGAQRGTHAPRHTAEMPGQRQALGGAPGDRPSPAPGPRLRQPACFPSPLPWLPGCPTPATHRALPGQREAGGGGALGGSSAPRRPFLHRGAGPRVGVAGQVPNFAGEKRYPGRSGGWGRAAARRRQGGVLRTLPRVLGCHLVVGESRSCPPRAKGVKIDFFRRRGSCLSQPSGGRGEDVKRSYICSSVETLLPPLFCWMPLQDSVPGSVMEVGRRFRSADTNLNIAIATASSPPR